jgi:branched-chain amino acid transport system permease protein
MACLERKLGFDMGSRWRRAGIGFILIVLLSLPFLIRIPYLLHVLVLSAMYVAYALSYDIAVGHVGTVSLAHPAFFGLGAYVAGILGTKYAVPFWGNMIIAVVLALILAVLMSVPAFRLADISFAIATLGLALFTQLVAHNWVELTRGPMCINDVPRPSINLTGTEPSFVLSLGGYYYLFLVVDLIVIALYSALTTGRLGRTFTAIRNDEILASTMGVHVLRYKRAAFMVGACMAGAIGSLWAQYTTVVCPDYLGISYTLNLLIIVFVGGAGNLWGVTGGAILLTILPEVLRMAPSIRMILFGIVLLLIVVAMPQGLSGVFSSLTKRLSRNNVAALHRFDPNSGSEKDSQGGPA